MIAVSWLAKMKAETDRHNLVTVTSSYRFVPRKIVVLSEIDHINMQS